MSFSKRPGKNTPQCYTKPLELLKNWNNHFLWVDEKVFPTVVAWRTGAPKDEMPSAHSYSVLDVATLNTRRTPFQKQPELLFFLVGLSRRYFLGDDVYPTFLNDDDREMDLFNLISALNPAKVKTGTRSRTAHEVPLLTATARRVIEIEDPVATSTSSETPFVMEKSPLDFSSEDPPPMITNKGETEDQAPAVASQEVPSAENTATAEIVPELNLEKEATAKEPSDNKRRRKRDQSAMKGNAPPKVLRKDHASVHPAQDTRGGGVSSCHRVRSGASLPYVRATKCKQDVAQSSKIAAVVADPDSKNTSFTSMAGSPGSIYQPGWIVTNGRRLNTPGTCQDLVDYIASPGYFSELRHLPNDDFLSQYNINLVRQVAIGSQLRLRFEQEAKLLKNSVAQVARRDQRIQARENEIKNLEALLEAEADAQITSEEKIKAAFEEFKKYKDERVNSRDRGSPLGHWARPAPCRYEVCLIVKDKCIRDLRPSTSQLKIHIYPVVRNLRDPWAIKEEILLDDAIAANVSRGEKKKKCRVVCRTYGVGSAYHARSDGIPVSATTVAPQGLAILLADAFTQTEISEGEASPKLLRSMSLPAMYNLDWP
ncbi:hypothetical protein Tco_0844362 [Tanacetum coccineum]